MPTTRKKVIKTVYKDEEDSAEEAGDFSDSGSDAKISEEESSSDEEIEHDASSGDEFKSTSKLKQRPSKVRPVNRPKNFAKTFINKISNQTSVGVDNENSDVPPTLFTVKDLTEADKLLPPILNLSESDSSDDESPKLTSRNTTATSNISQLQEHDTDDESKTEYKDVWSQNIQADSEEVARKAFLELEKHKSEIEKTKAHLHNYTVKEQTENEFDVSDLLAQGEEEIPEIKQPVKKKNKSKKVKDESDSDVDDWEEVQESKAIPQQGLQLVVELPDSVCRKTKKIDVEMMMRRKINRVKKEYQVYMHKVHVLCWIGHGNHVSRALNDQEVLAATLSLVPSKECYPGERVDIKYLEQITTWYKDKLTLKQDKNENKFRPKAPPLKEILLGQVKSRTVTARKYLVFIFVAMLRALGLQCRVMFNFVALPIKPPSSELCSLSTKPKEDKSGSKPKSSESKPNPSVSKPKSKAPVKDDRSDKVATSQCKKSRSKPKNQDKISQVDGNDDSFIETHANIMQLDGNDDTLPAQTRSTRARKAKTVTKNETEDNVSPPKRTRKSPSPKPRKTATKAATKVETKSDSSDNSQISKTVTKKETEDDVSPPKRTRKSPSPKPKKAATKEMKKVETKSDSGDSSQISQSVTKNEIEDDISLSKSTRNSPNPKPQQAATKATKKVETKSDSVDISHISNIQISNISDKPPAISPRKTRSNRKNDNKESVNNDRELQKNINKSQPKPKAPKIVVTKAKQEDNQSSKYFSNETSSTDNVKTRTSRKRSITATPDDSESKTDQKSIKGRTKSANAGEKSKYFKLGTESPGIQNKRSRLSLKTNKSTDVKKEDQQRVSHRDLAQQRAKPKNDVKDDLINIIKGRVKEAKDDSKKGKVKGKFKPESDGDSDFLPEENAHHRKSDSDDEFKPSKISPRPKPSTSKKIDRRVISSSESDTPTNKIDVWCEVFVEELEQWIAVNVVKGTVHCAESLYAGATHPVCYVVGWDNNNYLKDLTRRYVPHWNTVTRKQRAEPSWWATAVRPWLGPSNARDKEENEQLDRMQLEAPLPKSIAEYKNHPLYALKRHLLKFEAIYPPDAAVLGFVRGEAVHARECVHTCRSRDTWLKEAKVVRLGEQPYKVVKARPKWDKLSNKLITDKPLEVFGPWQVQDYEPPTAENGVVPRNAYGNVELFKACMLPKGTVHIKLPGLNKVAKKLNIDCAPAMTGFDFNGGWSHPVYDGFVVCEEFADIITEAWAEDQEEQERKEIEKTEARVYGHWRRLIKGLLIRERLKNKYGFQEPSTSKDKKNAKGPRLVVKKK